MFGYPTTFSTLLATTPPFARSVPPDVKDWCLEQISTGARSASRLSIQNAIKRLVDTRHETTIWQRMARVKRHHPDFNELEICMDAVTAAADWNRYEKVRSADTVKANKRLQVLLEEAVTLIPKVGIDTPLMMRNASLLEGDPLSIQLYHDEIEDKCLDQHLPPAVHILQAMHGALQTFPVRHANQPFKTGAATAERTYLIMRLKANFTRQIGSVPYELVAELVNVTMNRVDTTADIVRKV